MPGRKYWLYTLGSLNLRPHGLDMSIIHLACLHNLKSWPFLIWHWLLNHFAWRSGGFPRQTPPFFKTSIFSKKFRDRLLYDLSLWRCAEKGREKTKPKPKTWVNTISMRHAGRSPKSHEAKTISPVRLLPILLTSHVKFSLLGPYPNSRIDRSINQAGSSRHHSPSHQMKMLSYNCHLIIIRVCYYGNELTNLEWLMEHQQHKCTSLIWRVPALLFCLGYTVAWWHFCRTERDLNLILNIQTIKYHKVALRFETSHISSLWFWWRSHIK